MDTNKTELAALIEKIANAKKNTQKNVERSANFARYVRDRMLEMGIQRLECGVYISTVKSSAGGINNGVYIDESGDLTEDTVSSRRKNYYLNGDFNAPIEYPSFADIQQLSILAPKILEELAELANVELPFPETGE